MAYIQDLRAKVGHMPLILTSASGALLNQQHQVLLQERADTGNWGFPGGYSEFGETFAQTAEREFLEDAGIAVKADHLLGIFDDDFYTYPNGDQCQPINAFFLVEADNKPSQKAKPSETIKTAWFDVNQPPTFFNRQHQKMMAVIARYVKHHYSV